MQEILILGRGGQGAQTAGNQLARAFFAEGQYVQTFATYGGARRGTPVASSLRADDKPIRLRSNIDHASALLCFDESLLDAAFLQLADPDALIVVNSSRERAAFDGQFAELGAFNILPVNGRKIAQENDMGKVVNSALLGALVAVLNQPKLETICAVIDETAPSRRAQNVASCRQAYQQISETL